MRRNLKKTIISVILVAATFFTYGCSGDGDIKKAETTAKAYLTAVSGFNLDAMETYLSEGTNEDFGIDTTAISKDYQQTDTYKKAVESMFKALGGTMEYTINSSEKIDKETVEIRATIKYADANQEAVDKYMQQRADEYVQMHPEFFYKTELEQSDVGITVMADAYKTFLQMQGKLSRDIKMTLVKKDDMWKVLNGDENRDLVNLFSDIFGTY